MTYCEKYLVLEWTIFCERSQCFIRPGDASGCFKMAATPVGISGSCSGGDDDGEMEKIGLFNRVSSANERLIDTPLADDYFRLENGQKKVVFNIIKTKKWCHMRRIVKFIFLRREPFCFEQKIKLKFSRFKHGIFSMKLYRSMIWKKKGQVQGVWKGGFVHRSCDIKVLHTHALTHTHTFRFKKNCYTCVQYSVMISIFQNFLERLPDSRSAFHVSQL